MKLRDATVDFLYAKDYTPKSRAWFKDSLTRLVSWCEEEQTQDVEGLNAPLLRRYIQVLREKTTRYGRPMASTTLAGHHEVMRVFVQFCCTEYGLDAGLPARLQPPKVTQQVIPTFSTQQIEALFKAADAQPFPELAARDRAMLCLLFDTGLRASELASLRVERCVLTPEESYITVDGKGRKQRELGLGVRTRKALFRYVTRFREKSECPFVFLARTGQAMDAHEVHRIFSRLGKSAGVTGVRCSPHTARHSFAVRYMEQPGADVFKLSRLLGHERIQTSETYLRDFRARDARRGVSVLDTL